MEAGVPLNSHAALGASDGKPTVEVTESAVRGKRVRILRDGFFLIYKKLFAFAKNLVLHPFEAIVDFFKNMFLGV